MSAAAGAASRYLGPEEAPTRAEVEKTQGFVLLEFGTEWCGYCRAIAPQVRNLLAEHSSVRHVKVEDGPGRPLGRSFHVRLWPSFVFLKDGVAQNQLARPSARELRDAFAAFVGAPAGTP